MKNSDSPRDPAPSPQDEDDTAISADTDLENGSDLVTYWRDKGVIGSRPDIKDSQTHAREIRRRVQHRTLT